MCRWRRLLVFTLVVTLVMLVGTVTWAQPDSALTPSYFDGADDDLELWIAAEGSPVLVLDPAMSFAGLFLLMAVIFRQLAPPRQLTRQFCRLRAPPLP